ncbi:rhodanese-like domain-containing protein [Lacinutrix chionoecetis]
MKHIVIIIIAFFSVSALAQKTVGDLLQQYNKHTVPYISVQELAMPKTKAVIFDTREIEEYKISHIKDAVYVGYNEFDIDLIETQYPNKEEEIVVYCSIGIRSEAIGEKLKKAGYTNIFNLYGGIFEWKNKNFSIINSDSKETDKVHTFNKTWSKWLEKGEKVYTVDEIMQ